MDESQKRKAPTNATSGTDDHTTVSSDVVTKISRLRLDHQSATGPTTRQPTMASPRLTQTDPPGLNEDTLNLMAETTMNSPAHDKPSKSKKKKKRAADNATASAPSTPAAAGNYTSEAYEVVQIIMTWESSASNWIDSDALFMIKCYCLDANAQKINVFPQVLAQSVQSLQKEVDNHKEQLEKLQDAADHFLNLEGAKDYAEHLEAAMALVNNGVDGCQQFVDELKGVQDTLPPVETE
ncbi:hypothetical protein KC347_g3811 [Hortaea werneckii]|nr:hypothetical protein KC347_g3811 [Hortaea werneckii]